MRFLVVSRFKGPPTAEALALLPEETARGLELDAQGVREALYLAADQSASYQVLRAADASALDTVLQSLPLTPFVEHTITPLAD